MNRGKPETQLAAMTDKGKTTEKIPRLDRSEAQVSKPRVTKESSKEKGKPSRSQRMPVAEVNVSNSAQVCDGESDRERRFRLRQQADLDKDVDESIAIEAELPPTGDDEDSEITFRSQTQVTNRQLIELAKQEIIRELFPGKEVSGEEEQSLTKEQLIKKAKEEIYKDLLKDDQLAQKVVDKWAVVPGSSDQGKLSGDLQTQVANKLKALALATQSPSDVTVYRRAIPIASDSTPSQVRRVSDETVDASLNLLNSSDEAEISRLETSLPAGEAPPDLPSALNNPGPSSSVATRPEDPRLLAEQLLREAENSKAELIQQQGNAVQVHIQSDRNYPVPMEVGPTPFACDLEFSALTSHVDRTLVDKINNNVVDFELCRLLPKVKKFKSGVTTERRLQMLNRDGYSFLVAGEEKEFQLIDSFHKWQEAFRIFADLYEASHPGRSRELNQYAFRIEDASKYFVWDNVAAYDQKFREFVTRFPTRKWSVVHYESWITMLKEPVGRVFQARAVETRPGPQSNVNVDFCWNFNKGHCEYANCRFAHRCMTCGGQHAFINCGRRGAKKSKGNRNGGSKHNGSGGNKPAIKN